MREIQELYPWWMATLREHDYRPHAIQDPAARKAVLDALRRHGIEVGPGREIYERPSRASRGYGFQPRGEDR